MPYDPEITSLIGIDVGTRTTIVSAYDTRTKMHRYIQPSGSNSYFPSIYSICPSGTKFGHDLQELLREEPDSQYRRYLVQNFKIDFWKPNTPSASAIRHLKDWLGIIYTHLVDIQADTGAKYCFTYPAQRQNLEPLYKNIIVAAGFPEADIHFLDEPIAASYQCFVSGDISDAAMKNSLLKRIKAALQKSGISELEDKTGLFIDIGAGTTDYTFVKIQKDSLKVEDSSSVARAGNDMTRGMKLLLPEEKNMFDSALAFEFDRIERTKHKFSDWYRHSDDSDSRCERKIHKYSLHFATDSFSDFQKTADATWTYIRKNIRNRMSELALNSDDIAFVTCIGGGALHTGLLGYLKNEYGDRVHLSSNPHLVVATGATEHLKLIYDKEPKKTLRIEQIISIDVKLHFPEDTKQKSIELLKNGDVVPNNIDLRMWSKSITLESNWFLAEGNAYITAGDETIWLPEFDIKWEMFGERNDHKGQVDWKYDVNSGQLNVTISLNKVELSDGKRKVLAKVDVPVKPRGTYHD